MDETRALTEEEVRNLFLEHIKNMIEYWLAENRTEKRKLEGLAFSILVAIDGETDLPAFKLIPDPHPEDKQDHIDNGENWFPDDIDIAGCLHELFYTKEEVRSENKTELSKLKRCSSCGSTFFSSCIVQDKEIKERKAWICCNCGMIYKIK